MEFNRSWGAIMRYVVLLENDLCCKECEVLQEVWLDQANRWWKCVLDCEMSVSKTYEMSGFWLMEKGLVLYSESWLFGKGEFIEIGPLGNVSVCYALVFWGGAMGKKSVRTICIN